MDIDREKVKTAYQQMSKKEKLGYIFQNYWLRMVVGSVLLVILVSVVGHFTFNRPPEPCLQIGIRAKVMDLEAVDVLAEHLAERYPELTEDGEKAFRVDQFYSGYTREAAEEANAIMYKLAGSVASGMLDVVVGDQESMVNDVSMGLYLDLREVFTEEELKELETLAAQRAPEGKEGLLYVSYKRVTNNGRVEEISKDLPCFICITGGDEQLDACAPMEPLYVGIIHNTAHLDQVKEWIWSLLKENAD